jgi:hypothetical protein
MRCSWCGHNRLLSIVKKILMNENTAPRFTRVLILVVTMVAASLSSFSQGSQGTIQGGVADSSGGAIVGAKVTVTDVARGVARNLTTDDAGQYVAPALTAGTYTVRAEAGGFNVLERNNVLVEVGQNVRVDLVLSPGANTQTVTVTEEIPAIDTTSATLGGTVSNQSILALPLNGRNFFRLLELRPGIVTVPGSRSGSSTSNGRRTGSDVILVEGLTEFDMTTSNNIINGAGEGSGDSSSALPIDAIQEFNTQQNPPAEYGWRDGSVVNVGVKSGTNDLHGTAYAFGRDASATDASNDFTHVITPATLEQFGATAGGRVIKDKLFWFAGYEGQRLTVGNISSITIPSDVGLTPVNPNLSMVDACNAVKAQAAPNNQINALSAQLVGLNPASCAVSPPSSTIENVFPYNPTTSNVFYPTVATSQPLNNGVAKGDWEINNHNHLSAFLFVSKNTALVGGALQPYWTNQGINSVEDYAGSWTWTPNSTWVNEFRAGYADLADINNYPDNAKLPSDPYPTGYSFNTGVTNRSLGGFPTINFNNGITSLGITPASSKGPDGQAVFKDSVSYLRGKHSFKFGFEHVLSVLDNSQRNLDGGTILFDSLTTFLQGIPTNGSIQTGDPTVRLRQQWNAAFIQDTWRVTPRITVTPGLRYEYDGPPHELNNYLGHFDPTLPGGMAQVGPGLPYSELYHAQKDDFAPRVGLAWDIRGNGRTVLRGGVGLMSNIVAMTSSAQYVPVGASIPQAGINNAGTALNSHTADNLSFTAAQLLGGWNLTGPVFPIVSATGLSCTTAVQCTTGGIDPNFKNPRSAQWNVDIQHALTNQLSLDVAYVGVHGYNEQYSRDLNAVPAGTGWDPATVAACLANASSCKVNTAAIVAARPFNTAFPWFNYIVENTSGFRSNYNGLQVTLEGRSYHGLSFLSAYTYGHALDQWSKNSQGTEMVADPANPQAQYGNSDNDIRHRFRFSPTWAIPGKKSPGQMLEGWSLSGILALQSGLPWDPEDNTRNDWVGTGENLNQYVSNNTGDVQYWNFTGPRSGFASGSAPIPCYNGANGKIAGCTSLASAPAAIQTACTTAAQAPYSNATQQALALQALANNACYVRGGGIMTPPAYGTNGDAGRNSFRGPAFYNVDMSISKSWHFRERYSAQFRAEFFNLLNIPTVGAPGATDPTKGLNGRFGYANSTPDARNAVFGSGGPRHIQFGLKLNF